MFFLCTYILSGDAQIVPLYISAPRCIFLKSDQNLSISLVYYFDGYANVAMNLKGTQGYSIDENLSKDNRGTLRLRIDVYKVPSNIYRIPMTVNLYFGKMPDTVNYYLFVPEFKPGKSIDVTIPDKVDKHILVDIPGKTQPILNNTKGGMWSPVPSFDITAIVFPGYKSKE